jgi:hypothetical protein
MAPLRTTSGALAGGNGNGGPACCAILSLQVLEKPAHRSSEVDPWRSNGPF